MPSDGGSSRPVPRLLGRYALYEKIASGGMASVHLARLIGPVGFSRTVAIKRLHPHYASDVELVSMLLDEAHLAARIRHPNVVPTLDVVADEGELFLVMEYVQGESLNRLLGAVVTAKAHVEPRVASAIACDLLRGLHAAHETTSESGDPLGIVHRDVSPHNVIVGVDGVARVLDFGIAKAVSRVQTTREGQLKGKLAYMSPEQMTGGEVDRRTDVYAASVVLWETLTAKRLYQAATDVELLAKIHAGGIKPPSAEMNELVSATLSMGTLEDLDAIVMKGLAKDPAQRFATAGEMARALEENLPPAPRDQVGAWVKRMARTALEKRSACLADIESDISLTPMPRPAELLEAIKSPVASEAPAPLSEDAETLPAPRQAPSTAPNMSLPPHGGKRSAARAYLPLLLMLGMTIVTALLYVALARPTAKPAAAPSTDAIPLAPTPHAITDFPPPSSANPEAVAAYKTGLAQLRDASEIPALGSFERATTLDPQMGAAHLRRAIFASLFSGDDIAARQGFTRATQQRDNLSERDRALLDVMEPYLTRDPSDLAETESRAGALSTAHPDDAELAYYAGLFHYARGRHAEAVIDFERAVRSDPKFSLALAYEAGAEAYAGDVAGAKNTVTRCLASSPLGSRCLFSQYQLDADQGACEAEEVVAKSWIARDPSDYYGYGVLALSLGALGRPPVAVQAALDQKWAHYPSAKKWREGTDRARVDVLAGDFAAAEEKLTRILATADVTDTSLASHAVPADLLAELYRETGRLPQAARVAEEFLNKSEVWVTPHLADDYVISMDAAPRMLATLRLAGKISEKEFQKRRGAWVDRWEKRAAGLYLRSLWVYGYAWTVDTPEEARAALEVLPEYAPLPEFAPLEAGPALVGRTFLLAGKGDEARASLRKATVACTTLLHPFAHTRAYDDLGTALEQGGDVPGACGAYQAVLTRWGAARPASVTAAHAHLRSVALSCPP